MRQPSTGPHSLFDFIGKKTTTLVLFGVLVGVVCFSFELFFAYFLQIFFVTLGIVEKSMVALPKFFSFDLTSMDSKTFLILFFLVGCARAATLSVQVFLQGAAFDEARYSIRKKILTWVFNSNKVSSSEIMTLFNDRVNAAAAAVMALQGVALNGVQLLLLAVNLFYLSWQITTVGLLFAVISLPVMKLLDSFIKKNSNAIALHSENTNKNLVRNIKNLLLMQIYGTQRLKEDRTQHALKEYYRNSIGFHSISSIKFFFPQLVGVLLITLVAASSNVFLTISGAVLISYLYLLIRFVQLSSATVLNLSAFFHNKTQVNLLWSWWKNQTAVTEKSKSSSVQTSSVFKKAPGWKVENLSFAYGDKKILQDINFEINPASTFVLYGASGVGKSTLVHLLLGQLRPSKGSVAVLADSNADAESQISALHKNIGYVGPEPFLVEGTIRDNLLYGFTGETNTPEFEKNLQTVLESTECQFVWSLPEKLDYYLSEQGHGLSAGQKQRIGLARALLRKPKALILDEATSNLDVHTEAKLIETFKKLKESGDLTIIAVTHRQGLLAIADEKLLLQ